MFKYRFTGEAPETFPTLAELVLVQNRSITLEPGEEIEVSDPVLHARLEPLDKATAKATSALAEPQPEAEAVEPEPEAAPEQQSADAAPVTKEV